MKTIAAKQLSRYLREHPEAVLVDLRPPQAYQLSHVSSAVNIPYVLLEKRQKDMSKAREWIFYCERGGSAMAAARSLGDAGWKTMAVIGAYEDICRLTETASGDRM